jgi:disulfide bond formation protein DsbB
MSPLTLMQFFISLAAIFGSLFFSEILELTPCDLCWYQRICMYPIALIALTGVYLKSPVTNQFITPFAWLGLVISVYHNLLYYKIIDVIVPCSEFSPCTAQQINYLGFITIPLLSMTSFILVVVLNSLSILGNKKDSNEK